LTAVVVGASTGLGRCLADRLAAAGHDLVIASSDERDVAALASDLRTRHGIRVTDVAIDLGGSSADPEPLERAAADLGAADALLLPIGWTAPRDDGCRDPELTERLVRTNFLSVTTVVSTFLPALRRRPRAAIVGFGSIAAVRGRGANVIYAASKRALQTFFEGLRHGCADTQVRVQFYVLGYLDTNLAFGRKTLLPRANPDRLAANVVRDLGRSEGVVYYPGWWRPVCALISIMPWFVFKRLRF
jgi:short-subunit dehydrogenase